MEKIYILDVSGFIFRAYYALPPMANSKGESTHGLFGFIRSLLKLFKELQPTHVVAVFDGPDNKKKRLELYEKYKANRTRIHEDLPRQIERAKEFCHAFGVSVVEVGGVEADDAMGCLARWAKNKGWTTFLCTSDKDLCQLVDESVFIVNPWKEFALLDAKKVEENFGLPPSAIPDYLALVGDPSDNIPGLKGFGPKTAVALLKEFGTLENLLNHAESVQGEHKQKTLREGGEIARLSKKLATIHADIECPIDEGCFSRKKVDREALKEFYKAEEFDSLLRELETISAESLENYFIIEDLPTLDSFLEKLKGFSEIAFTIVGSHGPPTVASIVGISFCVEEGSAYYIPCNGKLEKREIFKKLNPLFENPSISFFGHNTKNDLHLLQNEAIALPRLCFDTVLASYLLHSESRKHSLDHLALQNVGKVKTSFKSLVGTGKKEIPVEEVDLVKMCHYASETVSLIFKLKALLERELVEKKLLSLLLDLELPLSFVLFKMERKGIFLDISYLQQMAHEIKRDIEKLEEEIHHLAGIKFNLNSPKQLSSVLFETMQIKPLKKTSTGLSTSAEVLETLAEVYPIARKILEYRTLEKLSSTYLESLPLEVNRDTHRIHPTFNQTVAATGRLSCQDPNLQNIPVRGELGKKIREAFLPQKRGWNFLAADYSQIELRLLAHLSEDANLLKAFKEGEDIHRYTASLVLGRPYEQVTKKERDQAKAINFGIIYGQQAFGLAKELGIAVQDAAHFIAAYFDRYPKVLSFIEWCVESARKTGKSVTMTGRVRDIPEINSSNAFLRQAATRLAINTPLQGSAADLIKLAMLEIDRELQKKGMKSFMILQVHDELIFEAPLEELDELSRLVRRAMVSVFTLKVPLVVDVIVGKNWGEC